MGFRTLLGVGLSQLLLACCGALVWLAWSNGLYANAVVAGLIALWVGGRQVWRSHRTALSRGAERREARPPVETGGRWKAFLDQTPTPLVALQADGALVAVNRAARSLFQTDHRIIRPPEGLAAAIQSSVAGTRLALPLPTPTGPRAFAVSPADVIDEEGLVRLGVLTDIQSEIHGAEAAALRDLLQVLSHEIMNSLTPAASLAETAAEYLQDETSENAGAAREALAVLSRRTSGLARFVEGYRTLARLPAPEPRTVRLAELLDDAARLFRARWGAEVTLVVEPAASEAVLEIDPDLTAQALMNVLSNGAEAALETAPSPVVTLSGWSRDGRAEISVTDNGAGVAEDKIEAVFAPFFTTKARGAGVGLSLARQIALSHGGELALVNGPGGARFVFRF